MTSNVLNVGDRAPDFALPSSDDREIRLSDFFSQKNVVLLFYPFAFSPVCSLQLPAYQARKPEFDKHDAQLLGISTDSKWSVKAFALQLGLEYPLLSDYHRRVSEAYGVLRADGSSARAVFVIDKEGIIRHAAVTAPGDQPDQKEVLRVLETLQ